MAAWRTLLFDSRTLVAQAELAANGVTFGGTLNAPGAAKATIQLLQPGPAGVTAAMLAPPDAVLAVEKDDVLMWAGFIWTHGANVDAGTYQLNAEGYLSYLRKRVLAFNTVTWTATEQEVLAWNLIQVANVPGLVDAHTGSGVLRDRTYLGYAQPAYIGKLLEDLAAVIDGFDFRFAPRWTAGPNSTLQVRFETSPPAGRDTGLVFELGANCHVPAASLDGTTLAYKAYITGQATDDYPLVSIRTSAAQGTHLLVEDILSVSDVADTNTLAGYGDRRLSRGSRPMQIPQVVVSLDYLGQVTVGDRCMFKADRGLLQLNEPCRITSWQADVDAGTLALTLAPLASFL